MPVVDIIIRTISKDNGAVSQLTGGLGKLAAQYLSVGVVTAGVYKTLKDSIRATLEYDNAVRQLAQTSGAGAEESSRLLQVLDDFKLSAGDVTAATRALTKQGLSPTLETLAQLSDEYNRLNPGQERADFLLKNFGRTGLQFAEAMSKGGDALREMGREVEKSLIRTDAQIAKTRLAELELDKWADKWQAFKVELGSEAIGILDGSNDAIQRQAQELFKASQGFEFNTSMAKRYTQAQRDAWEEAKKSATEQYLLSQGVDLATEAIENQIPSLEDRAAALKEVSRINQGMLSLIGDMQGAEDRYHENAKSLNDERINIEAERAAAVAAGWWEGSEKIREYDESLAENTRRTQENEAEFKRANLEIISGLVERKLMQDGVLDDKEFEWLLQKRQEWGLYSADVVEKARAAWKEADRITSSIANIPSSKTITITTNHVNTYTELKNTAPGYYASEKHASGGMFTIPYSYGNEGFSLGGRDTASGGEKLAIAPEGRDFIDYRKFGREMEQAYMRALSKAGG